MGAQAVVIGASTDGIAAIGQILQGLPKDLPATIFVVQHVGRWVPSTLPEILARRTELGVCAARDGAAVEPRTVYVAPSNRHMLIEAGRIRLGDGPRENRHRPAIDATMRSVALAYGARAIGVVLTGYMFDGAAGLLAIKDRGGVAIVQDPADAAASEMPRAALARVPIDYTTKLPDVPRVLRRLVADPRVGPTVPATQLELENRIASGTAGVAEIAELLRAATCTTRSCPICTQPLFALDEPRLRRFRCRAGHAFSDDSLVVDAGARRRRASYQPRT